MAGRHKRRRRRAGALRYLTVVCACVVLLVGAACLFGLRLQERQTDQVSRLLREQFHSAEATQAAQILSDATDEVVAISDAEPQEQAPATVPIPDRQADPSAAAPVETIAAADSVADETEAPDGFAGQVAMAAYAESNGPAVDPTASPEPELQQAFAELYAQNNDLVGWLQVCDHIEEPVLWRDNSFYMDHDFYGQSSTSGSIFLDERNGQAMQDDLLLLYGHNMKSGAMFGDLDLFRNQEYLAAYPIIRLQSAWEAEPRQYAIFSLFDASMNSDDPSYIQIRRFDFAGDEEKQEFIDELCARSIFDIPLEVDAQDQLVMLVTCSYSHDNGRFLIVARELREGETLDSITELMR